MIKANTLIKLTLLCIPFILLLGCDSRVKQENESIKQQLQHIQSQLDNQKKEAASLQKESADLKKAKSDIQSQLDNQKKETASLRKESADIEKAKAEKLIQIDRERAFTAYRELKTLSVLFEEENLNFSDYTKKYLTVKGSVTALIDEFPKDQKWFIVRTRFMTMLQLFTNFKNDWEGFNELIQKIRSDEIKNKNKFPSLRDKIELDFDQFAKKAIVDRNAVLDRYKKSIRESFKPLEEDIKEL